MNLEIPDLYPNLDEEHPDAQFIDDHLQQIERIDIVDDPWNDDHVLCFGMVLSVGGKQINVGAWWVDEDLYANCKFFNYNQIARQEVTKWITSRLSTLNTESA